MQANREAMSSWLSSGSRSGLRQPSLNSNAMSGSTQNNNGAPMGGSYPVAPDRPGDLLPPGTYRVVGSPDQVSSQIREHMSL